MYTCIDIIYHNACRGRPSKTCDALLARSHVGESDCPTADRAFPIISRYGAADRVAPTHIFSIY